MDTTGKVRQFILDNFYVEDPSGLSGGTSLLDQGILDSTGVLEVISFLEGEFAIKVDDAEMLPENLDSIDRIVAFIDRKRAAGLPKAV